MIKRIKKMGKSRVKPHLNPVNPSNLSNPSSDIFSNHSSD